MGKNTKYLINTNNYENSSLHFEIDVINNPCTQHSSKKVNMNINIEHVW